MFYEIKNSKGEAFAFFIEDIKCISIECKNEDCFSICIFFKTGECTHLHFDKGDYPNIEKQYRDMVFKLSKLEN